VKRILLVVAVLLSCAAGCVSAPGASRFTSVDLTRNLDAATLDRYRAERETVTGAGQVGGSLLLERTNRWPLGLLGYWQQGSVEAMQMGGGHDSYTVTTSRGYGPLSVFWVSSRTAMFSGDGELLHGMGTGSIFWGMLAMLHSMDAGRGHTQKSVGLLHHLVNVEWDYAGTSVSFFSAPNPAGFGR
jgi:hypothetical protein